jgi:hypothetical protein
MLRIDGVEIEMKSVRPWVPPEIFNQELSNSRILLETLRIAQLVKKHKFHGIQRFIILFTRAQIRFLS